MSKTMLTCWSGVQPIPPLNPTRSERNTGGAPGRPDKLASKATISVVMSTPPSRGVRPLEPRPVPSPLLAGAAANASALEPVAIWGR